MSFSSIFPELTGHAGGLEFAALTQCGFCFLELLVDNRAQHELLIGRAERVRGEMDAAFGKLRKIRSFFAAGDKLVGILRCEPDRETP